MRTKIAALLTEAEKLTDHGSDHSVDRGRCRALIGEMSRTMRQLMELSIELQRERDALASRLTRGSSIISTGKALLDVGPSNMEIREPETAGDSDWEGGGSPRSSQ